MPSLHQKLFRFDIDQSIRIEELNKASIIAMASREYTYTVMLSIHIKRHLYELFRSYGRPKQFAPLTFAATIVCAMQQSSIRADDLIIDIEYPGYEKTITHLIQHHTSPRYISFASIGKKSPAHYAAYGVHIGKQTVNYHITKQEILTILKKTPELLHR